MKGLVRDDAVKVVVVVWYGEFPFVVVCVECLCGVCVEYVRLDFGEGGGIEDRVIVGWRGCEYGCYYSIGGIIDYFGMVGGLFGRLVCGSWSGLEGEVVC